MAHCAGAHLLPPLTVPGSGSTGCGKSVLGVLRRKKEVESMDGPGRNQSGRRHRRVTRGRLAVGVGLAASPARARRFAPSRSVKNILDKINNGGSFIHPSPDTCLSLIFP